MLRLKLNHVRKSGHRRNFILIYHPHWFRLVAGKKAWNWLLTHCGWSQAWVFCTLYTTLLGNSVYTKGHESGQCCFYWFSSMFRHRRTAAVAMMAVKDQAWFLLKCPWMWMVQKIYFLKWNSSKWMAKHCLNQWILMVNIWVLISSLQKNI